MNIVGSGDDRMNVIDIGILLLLLMFVVVGIKRGAIKEAVSLIATILVFVLSFSLKGFVGNILCVLLPFFELDGFVTLNILFYQLVAFFLVFLVMLGIYSASIRISKVLQKIVNSTIILWLPSKILGGVVSLLKGYVVLLIVFMILMIPFGNFQLFKESKGINYMLYKTPVLSGYIKGFIDPVHDVLTLSDKVTKKTITVNEANLQTLDIMLKYKVVDKNTIESLREVHKLGSIQDIDSIMNKY